MGSSCHYTDVSDMLNFISASIGVGFLYPLIHQLILEVSKRIVENAENLSRELHQNGDRGWMLDLGDFLIKFSTDLSLFEIRSSVAIVISILFSLSSFLSLVYVALAGPKLCTGYAMYLYISGVTPVVVCFSFFWWWWDFSRPLIARTKDYYRLQ